ncbi:MAG: Sec-independent protein translocase protein TatB [Dissulfurimicrobium sp.]|uniref:Sec-independent protein translocase protein TatB n=1 Tax=Dissulfurimicrobium TaxID=1769732 RepID=UPI001EDB4CAE|nr:Sec-independent protein translocase protein TatB [Dissulfurimicrobium hydrothermale]UKL14191.1 Sec-independent protein translocase protein TatB [Dissulfurimicrobium hydrothermale]
MFGIGIPELVIIFIIALIVLGPEKLPQLARQLARLIAEFKKAAEDFKAQMDLEALNEIKSPKEMLKDVLAPKSDNTATSPGPEWKPAHPSGPNGGAGDHPQSTPAPIQNNNYEGSAEGHQRDPADGRIDKPVDSRSDVD